MTKTATRRWGSDSRGVEHRPCGRLGKAFVGHTASRQPALRHLATTLAVLGALATGCGDDATQSEPVVDPIPPDEITIEVPTYEPWGACGDGPETLLGYTVISLSDLSPLKGVRCILGDLRIQRDTVQTDDDVSALAALEEVWGNVDVAINGSYGPSTLDFPNLRLVDGTLRIINPANITSLTGFAALEAVGGGVEFQSLQDLTDFAPMPNLQWIGGDLRFNGVDAPSLGGFNALVHVGGDLQISSSQFTSISGLSGLRSIDGSLLVQNGQLESLAGLEGLGVVGRIDLIQAPFNDFTGLEGLSIIRRGLLVYRTPIESFDGLDALEHIGGNLSLNNTNLEDLSGLEPLRSLHGGVFFEGNQLLTSLAGLDNLEAIGGEIRLWSNPVLTDFDALEGAAGDLSTLYITGCPSLASLDGIASVNRIRTVRLQQLPLVASLQALGGVPITDDLTLIGLDGVTDLSPLSASDTLPLSIVLSDLSITTLAGLEGVLSDMESLQIQDNPGLVSLGGLENLRTISGQLTISDNASLTNLSGLTNLTTVANGIVRVRNNGLTSLDGLDSLTTVNSIEVRGNEQLVSLAGLESLQEASGVFITSNPALTSLTGLSGLTSLTQMDVRSNASLTSFDGIELPASISALVITGNSSLSDVAALDGLEEITSTLRVAENQQLLSLEGLSQLEAVGNLDIRSNDILEELGLDSLATITGTGGSAFRVQANPRLPECLVEFLAESVSSTANVFDIHSNRIDCECTDDGAGGQNAICE